MSNPNFYYNVIVSSTTKDLKEERKKAFNAIWKAGMFPIAMETASAISGADPISFSLDLVDRSNIYVGIFGMCYGHIPVDPRNPDQKSITEMEYRHAMGIPRLIFILDETIAPPCLSNEPCDSLNKLITLRDELLSSYVTGICTNLNDFEYQVYRSLITEKIKLAGPSLPIGETRTEAQVTLFGRDILIEDLKADLISSSKLNIHKSIMLYGISGIGKTSIANTLTYDAELRSEFKDVLWTSLGPDPDVLKHLKRWGKALGVATETNDLDEIKLRLAKKIQQRQQAQPLLLVIDDVWRVEDAVHFMLGHYHLLTSDLRSIASQLKARHKVSMVEVEELTLDSSISLLIDRTDNFENLKDDARITTFINNIGRLPEVLILMAELLNNIDGDLVTRLSRALASVNTPNDHFDKLYQQIDRSVTFLRNTQRGTAAISVLRTLALLPAEPNDFSEEALNAIADNDLNAIDLLMSYCLIKVVGTRFTLRRFIKQYIMEHS